MAGTWPTGWPAFTGALAARIVQLRPYDPESKGIVERANGYLETSFLPGRVFASPADFNAQLAGWLPRANARQVRSLGARPVDLIGADRASMSPLPAARPPTGFTSRARLPRDYYLRVLGNDYSIDPAVIGRMVEVTASLDTVTARCGSAQVACHPRSWARRQTVTDPAGYVLESIKEHHVVVWMLSELTTSRKKSRTGSRRSARRWAARPCVSSARIWLARNPGHFRTR